MNHVILKYNGNRNGNYTINNFNTFTDIIQEAMMFGDNHVIDFLFVSYTIAIIYNIIRYLNETK